MQHHVFDRCGVGLLVRGHQHVFRLPTAGRGDVFCRISFPFRRPLPPNRVPHPATLPVRSSPLDTPDAANHRTGGDYTASSGLSATGTPTSSRSPPEPSASPGVLTSDIDEL